MVRIENNIGGTERTVRIASGASLLAFGLAAPVWKPLRITAAAIGAISLVTGLIHYCPMNAALHRNTYPGAHHPHEEPASEEQAA